MPHFPSHDLRRVFGAEATLEDQKFHALHNVGPTQIVKKDVLRARNARRAEDTIHMLTPLLVGRKGFRNQAAAPARQTASFIEGRNLTGIMKERVAGLPALRASLDPDAGAIHVPSRTKERGFLESEPEVAAEHDHRLHDRIGDPPQLFL